MSTTFTVAHQASVSQAEFPTNPGDPHAVQHYLTLPGVSPSTVSITTPARTGATPASCSSPPTRVRAPRGR